MKNLKDFLYFVIILGLFSYAIYIYRNFEIETQDEPYYIIVFFIIFFPLFIKWIYFNKDNKKEGLLNTFINIGAVLLGPLLIGIPLMNAISIHYTMLLGEDITYFASIYDKEYKSERRKTYHYVRFSSIYGKEEINNGNIYDKTEIGSIIEIKKRISVVGSYIKYDDIQIYWK